MSETRRPFSLYLHIPYCISKCPYCDFNSHVVPEIPEREYTAALLKELDDYGRSQDWRHRPLQTIFFGGGTPSTFTPASIGAILEKAASLFPIEEEPEITLEANPGTVDNANFAGYRSCGINRISIGAQSFQPHLLKFLGRVHSAEETRQALRTVQRAGFENFSVDLIYASPGQSFLDLQADLAEALSFGPPHLSAYNLTIEEGTPFHREYRRGKIQTLSEETEIAMVELVEERLAKDGLERYEISNYAKPERHGRHNVNYWRLGDYLGIGAGAHSYRRSRQGSGLRWHNEKHPGRYMKRIKSDGRAVVGREEPDHETAAGEFMFLGLRMRQGIEVERFAGFFGKEPGEYYPKISVFKEEGLAEERNGYLRLTRRGFMVANSIFVNFV